MSQPSSIFPSICTLQRGTLRPAIEQRELFYDEVRIEEGWNDQYWSRIVSSLLEFRCWTETKAGTISLNLSDFDSRTVE